MLFDKGKLEKLTLRAYKPARKNEPPQVSIDPNDKYVVQVNPSSYTLNQLLNHSRHRTPGSSASEAVWNHSPPQSLTFEFLFDGTGVVPEPSELGDVPLVGALASALSGGPKKFVVWDEIKRFEKLAYKFYGKIHSPRQLQLVWGTLTLSCVLSSASYRFTLFKPDGTPLRAIATCTFCESEPPELTERKQNATSPDLTHLRDVRDGDSLPVLAYEIYGNPELYLEVARVNKLVNFRKLRSATRVAFPPVEAKA